MHPHNAVFVVIALGRSEYFDITLPLLTKLARRLGCDFHVVQDNSHRWISAATWLKLALLPRFLAYERIIVCDADILPNFGNLTEDDLALLNRGARPCLAPDQGQPVSNQRFVAWVKQHIGAEITAGAPYFNTGLMSFPRAFAQQLAGAFEAWGKTPDDYFHDQDFFNYWVQARSIPVRALPVTMNWIAPQHEESTLREAKLIHFAGPWKHLIPRYASLLAAS